MSTRSIFLTIAIILLAVVKAVSQPFTLDEELKPVKLTLEPNSDYEGSKYVESTATISQGEIDYYYIVGHDMYQFVDVFIFATEGDPDLQADVVFNTWDNIEETKHTNTSEDGIINFKLRSYQDISFTIKNLDAGDVSYTIIANASPPVMAHLGSPFVKASPENADISETPEAMDNVSSGTPLWIYATIGLLLLVVGLLAGKLLGRKKNMSILLFLIATSISTECFAQTLPVEEARRVNESTNTDRSMENIGIRETRRGQIDAGIDQLNKAFGTADAIKNYLEQYKNLGDCLGSTPPPGQPRIPSFCEDETNSCANCFLEARRNFNKARYTLEKLQTIYDCTKSYTDAAISFGDNVSSYHGVVGLVWQSKRREVEKSMVSLNKAYDEKRIELLEKLNNSLIALDACEQQHGMQDWYDRFGVMFYNFSEMRYHR